MHVTRGSTRPLPKKSPCRTPSEKAKHWTCLVACRIHSMRTRGGALKRAYDSGVQADPVHAAEPAVRAQVEVLGDDEHRPDAHEKSAEDDQGVSSAEQERRESSEPAQLAGDSARRDAQERADSAAAPLAAPLAADLLGSGPPIWQHQQLQAREGENLASADSGRSTGAAIETRDEQSLARCLGRRLGGGFRRRAARRPRWHTRPISVRVVAAGASRHAHSGRRDQSHRRGRGRG